MKCLCTVAVPRLVVRSSFIGIAEEHWNGKLQAANALVASSELGIHGSGYHGNDSALQLPANTRVSRCRHSNIELYDMDRDTDRAFQRRWGRVIQPDVTGRNLRIDRISVGNRLRNLNQTITYEIF